MKSTMIWEWMINIILQKERKTNRNELAALFILIHTISVTQNKYEEKAIICKEEVRGET